MYPLSVYSDDLKNNLNSLQIVIMKLVPPANDDPKKIEDKERFLSEPERDQKLVFVWFQ